MEHSLDELMWTFVTGELISDISFKCRWMDCFLGIADEDELARHLEEHVRQAIENWNPRTYLSCGIFSCHSQCSTPEELDAHIKHHFYHAKAQRNGLKILRQKLATLLNCGCTPCPVIQIPDEPLVCDWAYCEATLPDINSYLQHTREHVGSSEPMYYHDRKCIFMCQWKGCNSNGFADRYDLERHIRTHTGCRNCACPFCGRYISSSSRLVDHVNRNVEAAEFVCFLCNKPFGSERLLREHCERHVKTLQCPECPLVVQRESDLRAHIEMVHQKKRQFWCATCGRSYMKKSDLTKHSATHSGQTLRCPHCDQEFTWQKQLKHHLLTHEPDYIKSPYLCHLCGSTYQRGSALSKHLRTFHKLTVPAGFTRFQFKKCADNMYRLETERILSDELKMEFRDEIYSQIPGPP